MSQDKTTPTFSPNAGSAGSSNVTVQDVVNIAVEAINNRDQRRYNANDINGLIPTFSGNEDVKSWFSRIKAVKETFGIVEEVLILVLTNKLEGSAKRWYDSRPEYVTLSLEGLEEELTAMFQCRETKKTLMKNFESRKWKKTEKFTDYYFDKVLLGNKLDMSEEDVIEHLIDGLDDPYLETQAKMKEFTSLPKMLEVMNKITTSDRRSTVSFTRKPNTPSSSSSRIAVSGEASNSKVLRCFNCNGIGHIIKDCRKPIRQKGSCFQCGKMDHRYKDCPQRRSREETTPDSTSTVAIIEEQELTKAFTVTVTFTELNVSYKAILDTGSPISLISKELVSDVDLLPYNNNDIYLGINKSPLNILGIFNDSVIINDIVVKIKFHVIPPHTISYKILLGRDFISDGTIQVTFSDTVTIEKVKSMSKSNVVNEILLIDDIRTKAEPILNIEESLSNSQKYVITKIFEEEYLNVPRCLMPKINFEMMINLKTGYNPFYFKPRRLSMHEQKVVKNICEELLAQNIIKPSSSEYSSKIVLVKKKNGQTRMCVDFRELNKITLRDNFPIPNIEEQIDQLKNKTYFTKLDLKNAFFHVRVNSECTKFLSFVTPFGQYEYLKMPFGFCNSPSVFMRYINRIFIDLLNSGEILIYMDDILIATENFDDHLKILSKVYKLLVDNLLELRLEKCFFLNKEIEYLGYVVNVNGISPNPNNVKAVTDFPVPKNKKELHSFIGLISYFRKFIKDFSIIAKPLYDLLKANNEFEFDSKQLEVFDKFKTILSSKPVLSIYSPTAETQLHCDASSVGFGSILLQKQDDGQFHPIFFFSKRTTDAESHYHSYELECLCIVNSIKRFHVYLHGVKFKIFTDCDSFRLTLSKKDIVPRIMRWVLFLSEYNYEIEHRPNPRMRHVDALSRCHNILILEDNSFEQVLSIKQQTDPEILELRNKLETVQLPSFELRNGLVYRKSKKKDSLLFFVPKSMVHNVIRIYHDNVGHVGIDKTCELVQRTYWFPNLRDTVKNYISNCLKCIAFSPNYGKVEGELHSIPKGNVPFDTFHIDHYGPLEKCKNNDRYIFLIIDAFTKYIKLYPCRTTNTQEVIKYLKLYFVVYSKPNRIVSDRGSAFTSQAFKDFLENESVQLIHIATGSAWANGQIERFNRTVGPMLAKLCDSAENWNKVLPDVEFALNNTFVRSTGEAPSKLLFGVYQKGKSEDSVKQLLETIEIPKRENLLELRDKAAENIVKSQTYNKLRYDKTHKEPHKYKIGDKVVITNHVVTPGVNKKLLPKFKGPYEVEKILPHDRYILKDVDGHQITQMPYHGTLDASHMKLWSPDN